MSEKTKEQLQRYVDAAKLDLLDLLNRPTLNVFEFRRMAELCDTMIDLCNSAAGGFLLPQAITDAMWQSENGKAPTLFQALGGHIFDSETMLAEKYNAMARDHADMRQKIATAKLAERDYEGGRRALAAEIEAVTLEGAAVAAERQLINQRMADLEQRELALTAGEARLKQLSSGSPVDAEIVEDEQQGEAP